MPTDVAAFGPLIALAHEAHLSADDVYAILALVKTEELIRTLVTAVARGVLSAHYRGPVDAANDPLPAQVLDASQYTFSPKETL